MALVGTCCGLRRLVTHPYLPPPAPPGPLQGTDAEMQRPRAKGGTGLGLSICCKQVAVLGGTIGALSKPACGSVFWFTTPLLLPPHDASSAESLEASSEGEAAAEAALAEEVAAGADAPTPAQAAGAAAIRRSEEAAAGTALPSAAPPPAAGEVEASPLPTGIPVPHGLPHGARQQGSLESGATRPASGSRRQSMESDLSSMWPSHKSPRQPPGPRPEEEEQELGSYHPRHAFSWEQAPQPPSFTAAEMLQAMPLASPAGSSKAAAGPAAPPRRSLATGRPSMGSQVRHHAAPQGAGAAGAGAAASAAARQRQGGSSLQGLRVLLAEDNLINQTVAKRVLTSLGCQCQVASNGREAVTVSAADACPPRFCCSPACRGRVPVA